MQFVAFPTCGKLNPVFATSARLQILQKLAGLIIAIPCVHPLRVAIDGIDAAGKTALADELAELILKRGRPVIRASLDGFHRPRKERYRLGPDSPEGYYLDSFDYPAILASLLLPLGPGGDRRYRQATFDHLQDAPLPDAWEIAPQDSLLLMDGIFLLRQELNPAWDFRIFVKVSFATSVERGCQRDLLTSGQAGDEAYQALRQRYLKRYVPGQRIYLQSVQPESLADVIYVNDNLLQPFLIQKSSVKDNNGSYA